MFDQSRVSSVTGLGSGGGSGLGGFPTPVVSYIPPRAISLVDRTLKLLIA